MAWRAFSSLLLVKKLPDYRAIFLFQTSFKRTGCPKLPVFDPLCMRRDLLSTGAGIAFHHAGITPADRSTVEGLFLSGGVRILCSTSTLAGTVRPPWP